MGPLARGNQSSGNHFTKLTRNNHTLIRAGGDDDREVIDLTQGSVKEDTVVHILGAGVADYTDETDLMVNDEQSGVIPIDPLERVCSNCADVSGS